jgi:hypothetical protein
MKDRQERTEAVSENPNVTHEPGYFTKSFHSLVPSGIWLVSANRILLELTDLVSMRVVVILPTDIRNMAMA